MNYTGVTLEQLVKKAWGENVPLSAKPNRDMPFDPQLESVSNVSDLVSKGIMVPMRAFFNVLEDSNPSPEVMQAWDALYSAAKGALNSIFAVGFPDIEYTSGETLSDANSSGDITDWHKFDPQKSASANDGAELHRISDQLIDISASLAERVDVIAGEADDYGNTVSDEAIERGEFDNSLNTKYDSFREAWGNVTQAQTLVEGAYDILKKYGE